MKPIVGNIGVGGVLTEKEFCQENEWRYVPVQGKLLYENEYAVEKDASDKEMEADKLEIAPNDIRYIFVPDDNEMGHFPYDDLKMLTTRPNSLETIAKDF